MILEIITRIFVAILMPILYIIKFFIDIIVYALVWIVKMTPTILIFLFYAFQILIIFIVLSKIIKILKMIKRQIQTVGQNKKIKLQAQKTQERNSKIVVKEIELCNATKKEIDEILMNVELAQAEKQYMSTTIDVDNDERYSYYKNLELELDTLFGIKGIKEIKEFIKKYQDKQSIRTTWIQEIRNKSTTLIDGRCLNFNFPVDRLQGYCLGADMLKDEIYMLADQVYNDYKICLLGKKGEDIVNTEIDMYHNIINLPNIRLEVDGNSIENDNILLTKNGVFIVEVKNYGSSGKYDLIIEKDGRWSKRSVERENNRSNNEPEQLKNATAQNNRHIAYLSKFINTKMGLSFDDSIPVYGVVIIPNNTINIENNSFQDVYRVSELYGFIQSKPAALKHEQIKQLKELIENSSLPALKYKLNDTHDEIISRLKDYIELQNTFPQSTCEDIENKLNTYIKAKNELVQQ